MKKLIISFVAVGLFIIGVGLYTQNGANFSLPFGEKTEKKISIVTINNKEISVEIAKTAKEREKGLSGKTLDANSGLLFVFDSANKSQNFWMKGMIIPIDIIWIESGKIIRIDENVPTPEANTPDNKLKIYSAGKPVNYVLEVNAGYANSNSLKVGDTVTISE
jgi:uncharacterized membrane protein (UPF0127 family)